MQVAIVVLLSLILTLLMLIALHLQTWLAGLHNLLTQNTIAVAQVRDVLQASMDDYDDAEYDEEEDKLRW